MRLVLLLVAAALPACALIEQPTRMVSQSTRDWREIASPTDRARLHGWRSSFVDALNAARTAGHGAEIAAEGALLEPDAALPDAGIPNGDYRCRVIKLGAKSAGMLDYVGYPPFACRVATQGRLQSLAKLTGSQRPVGLLFRADVVRQVFLGTLALGDEPAAMQYGEDETRNVAGFLERIGPARWRLVMPRPHFESRLDVMELVPAGGK